MVVSVDYLTKPLQVFLEIGRVLRPKGTAYISFSNRFVRFLQRNISCE